MKCQVSIQHMNQVVLGVVWYGVVWSDCAEGFERELVTCRALVAQATHDLCSPEGSAPKGIARVITGPPLPLVHILQRRLQMVATLLPHRGTCCSVGAGQCPPGNLVPHVVAPTVPAQSKSQVLSVN